MSGFGALSWTTLRRRNMASSGLKFNMLWLLVVLIAHVAETKGKAKMIGDDAASDFQDNTVMLRSGKTSMADGPEPGDLANAFSVPTLGGEFSYEPGALRGHVIIHAFTNKSGFLECLWSSESSLTSLVEELPESTQVLFLSLDDSAVNDALWMQEQVQRVAFMHRCPERKVQQSTTSRPCSLKNFLHPHITCHNTDY